MTHHYDIDHLDQVDSAKDFPVAHAFKIHMNEKTGNSLYVFAEELSILSELYSDEVDGITPYQMNDWAAQSSNILIKFHQKYLYKIISKVFPEKHSKLRKIFIDDNLLWEIGDNLPLLHFGKTVRRED